MKNVGIFIRIIGFFCVVIGVVLAQMDAISISVFLVGVLALFSQELLDRVYFIPFLFRSVNTERFEAEFPMNDDKNGSLLVKFLGTSGLVISHGTSSSSPHATLIDPYVSRKCFSAFVYSKFLKLPLVPDEDSIGKLVDELSGFETCDVLIGHSHFDHFLDAPEIIQRLNLNKTNCGRIFGSQSCKVATDFFSRKAGHSIACYSVEQDGLGAPVRISDDIEFPQGVQYMPIRSRHGISRIVGIPNPGEIESISDWPPTYKDLKCGSVLNWLVTLGNRKVLHVGSVNIEAEDLRRRLMNIDQVDLLCMCAASWNGPSGIDYIARALEYSRPKYVTACHWDWFFGKANERNQKALVLLDLRKFLSKIQKTGKQLYDSKKLPNEPVVFFSSVNKEVRL